MFVCRGQYSLNSILCRKRYSLVCFVCKDDIYWSVSSVEDDISWSVSSVEDDIYWSVSSVEDNIYWSVSVLSIPSTFQLTTPTRGLRIRLPPPLRLGEGGWTERRTVETNRKEHLKRQEAIRKNAVIYTRNLLRIFPAPYLPSSLSDPCS